MPMMKKGLIIEVDLEYDEKVHNVHNDCPLAPEKIKVENRMLSNYCENIRQKYGISIGQVEKLIPTLANKGKYILHYRNLPLSFNLGLKLSQVHQVLQLNQSPWLKQYVDFNTQMRTDAKSAFEFFFFFKLMNDFVFGKTIEHLRKRVDVKRVTDENKKSGSCT